MLIFLLTLAQGPTGIMDALKPHQVTIEMVEYKGRKAARVRADLQASHFARLQT